MTLRQGMRRFGRMPHVALVAAAIMMPSSAGAAPPGPLIRFPTVSPDAIAFVAYGGLWSVPRRGGVAVRLTDDPGQILMPRFSPDGQTIAFTWRRQGGSDVYVIPSRGGSPVRLTYGPTLDSYDNLVTGWTPDGTSILFLSLRQTAFHRYETYSVPATGGLATPLGLEHSGMSSLSPDGKTIAFDRTFRNLGGDRWKHYVGGQASDIYLYGLKSHALERVTDWRGTDTAPMWAGRRIYFLSDRGMDRHVNIWVEDLDTKVTRQVTHFVDYDIDMPSIGPDGIAFQEGGKLYLIDLPSESLHIVSVVVRDTARLASRMTAAAAFIRHNDIAGLPDYALGADGRTAYLVARGDLFTVSASESHDLTRTVGVMEDHPAVSPDGKQLAFVTDASGEQQVAVMPVGRSGPPRQLTRFRSGVLYAPRWSPDGSHLLVADANKRLWLVRVSDGLTRQIAFDPFAEIHDAVFAPDGQRIAYSTTRPNQMRAIHVRDLQSDRDEVVSSFMESDHDPLFSTDSRTLYFVSLRNERPFVSDRDREGTIATLGSEGLFEAPLPPTRAPTASTNDPAGVTLRAVSVPVQLTGGIAALEMRGDTLFYRGTAASGIGGDLPGQMSSLHAFNTKSEKDRTVASDVGGYSLSSDGGTALVQRGSEWHLLPTAEPGTADVSDVKLATGSLQVPVALRSEYKEMFEQAWRLDRDLFWDPAMNSVDWHKVHDLYARIVPMIGSHEDLIYVLGEMQGELSTSHMFLGAGDQGDTRPHVGTGLLGVDFALDSASGRYRMTHVYRGDDSRARFRAPLGNPALGVADGDYLLAVDGRRLVAPEDPYMLLLGKTGRVALTVARASNGPERTINVEALGDESEIRKLDLIDRNRATVAKLSDGRLGYIYLSDFDALGSEDFERQFYPQATKAGLVIDLRDNGGGFTSQWVLDMLRRPQAGVFQNREGGITTLPGAVSPRSLAVLTNIFSRSDGDQFPYFFRKWGMGPVIGQRTWGGVRGLKGPWRLMDGTYITVPKDSLLSTDGAAIIEGVGAEPDITVDDEPGDLLAGRDAQLESAVTALNRH